LANDFLNHGNYLAYGLAATTLWVLGIPHAQLKSRLEALVQHWFSKNREQRYQYVLLVEIKEKSNA
jgi:hypothetical protein